MVLCLSHGEQRGELTHGQHQPRLPALLCWRHNRPCNNVLVLLFLTTFLWGIVRTP